MAIHYKWVQSPVNEYMDSFEGKMFAFTCNSYNAYAATEIEILFELEVIW